MTDWTEGMYGSNTAGGEYPAGAGATTSTALAYGAGTLPAEVRSRFVHNGNGIRTHVLEAGYSGGARGGGEDRPCVLLLHGFPELAYSWRRVLPALARVGFHAVAPDLRGYGRSGGADVAYGDDLRPFSLLNHVRDALGLVSALGHQTVAAVVGHDFGSPVAAWCALVRPDVFRSVVLMSAPFAGPPQLPFGTAGDGHDAQGGAGNGGGARAGTPDSSDAGIHAALAALDPPRTHYHRYYATPEANADMWRCRQGVHDFLRAYFHMKSADWRVGAGGAGNAPRRLSGGDAAALAELPRYYVMDRDRTMAETVAPEVPSPAEVAACRWLPDDDLRVYTAEYERTGFQGGLQNYRVSTDPASASELRLFSGRTIDVPAWFIAGASDWGVYQRPGALEAMQSAACSDFRGVHLVPGAGHWVQQEQPDAVNALLVRALTAQGGAPA